MDSPKSTSGVASRRSNAVPRQQKKLPSDAAVSLTSPSDQQSLVDKLQIDEKKALNRNNGTVGLNTLIGLTLAGLGASLLTTIFGLFHVDTFLTAYHLPTTTYSVGNVLYSIINTANDVAGAWFVDHMAQRRQRVDLVGVTGCLFALLFLTPFFRPWTDAKGWLWDGMHFVVSLSLYDTMYSFSMILYGSILTDDHEMTQSTRVRFLSIGKVVNMVSSFAVARIGLRLFDTQDLYPFRVFLVELALGVAALSIYSQGLAVGDRRFSWAHLWPAKSGAAVHSEPSSASATNSLEWRRVVHDFWNHKSFLAWIGMEMLLESQNSFNQFFRKTFMDRLVVDNGIDKEMCDWLVSAMKPASALLSLMMFIPMRKFGYPMVYRYLFLFNFATSISMLFIINPTNTTTTSTHWILAFLVVYPVVTTAVLSAGFGLGMADMVLQMKYQHASSGRLHEPSLAGMFMGANALVCKPMESFLPIVAALAMGNNDDDNDNNSDSNRAITEALTRTRLYYVLVLPPLVYSCLQWLSWRKYELEPNRVASIRVELRTLRTNSDTGSTEANAAATTV